MSETRAAWTEAFHKAQGGFPAITKSKTVDTGSYSYKYADLPTIIEQVSTALEDAGLSVAQAVVSQDGRIGVETRIYHVSGHVETFGPVFLPAGQDAKSAGSAVTYARRYSLSAALGIAADEDDDGRAASRPDVPRVDLADTIRSKVAIFSKWSEERRQSEWVAHAQDVLGGKPQTIGEVDQVIDAMASLYYDEHPTPPDEAPF